MAMATEIEKPNEVPSQSSDKLRGQKQVEEESSSTSQSKEGQLLDQAPENPSTSGTEDQTANKISGNEERKDVTGYTEPTGESDQVHKTHDDVNGSDSRASATPEKAKEHTDSQINTQEQGQDAAGKQSAIAEPKASEDGVHDSDTPEESRPEIDNIMDQFKDKQGQAPTEETTSPTGSNLPVFQRPPRSSSLQHIHSSSTFRSSTTGVSDFGIQSPPSSSADPEKISISRSSTMGSSTIEQPPPPAPDPEPDLPFDFHRFLEQLRHRTADPVAKFLRSFLQEFGKKQWMVHEQVKIISDFLTFITDRMAKCDVWRTVSDAEFDNAREGMEKLVMNRLYAQTFSPEIPPAEPMKTRRKGANLPLGPGRKGQHQEDVERDDVLAQKVRIYSWIREEHLDIQAVDDRGRRFLTLAQQELSKINSYRAPRDKVICVLNSCKVLFGYLRRAQSEQSADDFIPLLIYTVLKANPEHLVSNVQFILRFRNQDKLNGEAGYYMSSLMGAVQFIENLDRTSLTITEEDFEQNVEAAVSAIAERDEREGRRPTSTSTSNSHLHINEKAAPSRPEVTPRHSMEGEQVSPRKANAALQGHSRHGTDGESDGDDAVAGLIRSIQKPFSSIGKIFSDEDGHQPNQSQRTAASTAQHVQTPTGSPMPSSQGHLPTQQQTQQQLYQSRQHNAAAHEDAAARQASLEAAEVHKVQRAEHQTVVETLSGMFPDLDKDVISDVVRMKEGRFVHGSVTSFERWFADDCLRWMF